MSAAFSDESATRRQSLLTSHFSRDEQALVTMPPGPKSVPKPPVDLA
jgi:hypothetical protein